MKTKKGFSLVVLVITIIVMVMLTTIVVLRTANTTGEVEKNDFAFEIAVIEDKIEEYYLLMGELPVRQTSLYSFENIKTLLVDEDCKKAFEEEVNINEDTTNMFYAIDISILQLQLDERGKNETTTDIFVVATNSMNVYYLAGIEIDDVIYFSLAKIAENNDVSYTESETEIESTLDTSLNLTKNTNVWTNEIKVLIKDTLATDETLQYSIASAALKDVASNKIILINSSTMTNDEKTSFESNKTLTVNKLKNGVAVDSKTISIDNLDVTSPSLRDMTMVDTASDDYNNISIVSTDSGGSGVKAIYYDYSTILKDETETNYYSDRSNVSTSDLVSFGKASKDGSIQLEKHIKSIVAVAVDNAGNISATKTYTIDDTYLISK